MLARGLAYHWHIQDSISQLTMCSVWLRMWNAYLFMMPVILPDLYKTDSNIRLRYWKWKRPWYMMVSMVCLVLLMLLSLLAAFTVHSLCLLLDVSSTQSVPGSSVPFWPSFLLKPNCQTPFLLSWPPPSLHSLLKRNHAPDFDTALLQGTSIWLDPPNSIPPFSLLGAILKTIDDQMCPGKQLG